MPAEIFADGDQDYIEKFNTVAQQAFDGDAAAGRLDDHIDGTADKHAASAIVNTPAGGIAATDVQAAINELDNEKQPVNANLTALAGQTGAADKVSYWTAAATLALTTLGSFGRTMIAWADAAAARTGLGLGTLATLNDAPAGSLTGATLAAGVTASGLTSLGTLSSLAVSANGAALPAGLTGTTAHIGQADGVVTRLLMDSFAANTGISLRRANGTAAAPTALTSGQTIGAFYGFGYGATGYSTSGRAGFTVATSEAWTDTAQGAQLEFATTANGTAISQTVFRLANTGETQALFGLAVTGVQTITANSSSAGLTITQSGAGQALTTTGGVTGGMLTATSGLRYDDSGAYVSRNAVVTLQRNVDAPTGVIPTVHYVTAGKGDNTTLIGVSSGYMQARDRSDVDASNKGVLYALQLSVSPRVPRNNVPYDDAACLVVQNDAQVAGAKATDAIYVGHNAAMFPTAADKEFITAFGSDAHSDYGMHLAGANVNGIRLAGVYSSYGIHLKNDLFIGARNAANSADLPLIGLDGSNVVRVAGLGITASTGTLTIPNSAALITAGAYSVTLTATAATNVTLPTTGTLATLAGSETFTNKTLTSPAITGGTVNNSVIGGTTAAAANFTTLNASSLVRISVADSATPVFGISGTTKGVRVITTSSGTAIDGVDNTLTTSFQPLFLRGSTVSLSSGGTGILEASSGGVAVTGALSSTGALTAGTRLNLPSFTVATLPGIVTGGGLIYVSNEAGGAVIAFSDGTNWRRVTDRAIVS